MSRGLVVVMAVAGFLFHAAAVPYKNFHHPQTILLSNINTNTNTEQLEGSRRVHQLRFNTIPALPLSSSNKEESMDDAVATAKANDEKHFHRMASAPLLERLQHHLEHLHKQLGEVEDLGADVDKVVEGHASKDPGTNVDDKLEGHASNLLEEVEDHALNLADIIHSLNQTISNIEPSQLPTEEARKIFSSITLSLAKLDPGGAGLASGLEDVQRRQDDEERKNQQEEKVVDKVKVKEKEHEEKVENVVDKVKEEKHKEKVIDKMKDEEHNEEVVDKVKEEVEKVEVEATLADGLSIFAGWPNFCKILW